jgi:hypothetical protein
MRGMKSFRALLGLALALTVPPGAQATPPVGVETHFILGVEALTIRNGKANAAGRTQQTEIGPDRPGTVDFDIPWQAKGSSVAVHLDVRLTSVTPDGEAVLACESTATLSGSKPVTASREIRLADEGSGLFEVYGDGDRRILLTLQGEKVERAVVRPPATVGAPVRFMIGIERVDGERIVPLETNELHTFVGQSVEYSFRQGQDAGLEAVRLTVLPVSISGEVVTIDAEISGALPGSGGTTLVSHRERIVASRGATSRLQATAGTPPAGYRFQVTPEF